MEKPIINEAFLLQKVEGKGGWTYAFIPELSVDKQYRSLWINVKGTIDDHSFEHLKLAKIKAGGYFFPVKAEIRKILNKQEGDSVKITLFEDVSPFEIPEEIMECFKIDDTAYKAFIRLSESRQKECLTWIVSAKKEETKIERINATINKLLKG